MMPTPFCRVLEMSVNHILGRAGRGHNSGTLLMRTNTYSSCRICDRQSVYYSYRTQLVSYTKTYKSIQGEMYLHKDLSVHTREHVLTQRCTSPYKGQVFTQRRTSPYEGQVFTQRHTSPYQGHVFTQRRTSPYEGTCIYTKTH